MDTAKVAGLHPPWTGLEPRYKERISLEGDYHIFIMRGLPVGQILTNPGTSHLFVGVYQVLEASAAFNFFAQTHD